MPRVSVLMSSYNHEKFIAEAIRSVIGQSFSDFEFLIIDDQSIDKTFHIAKSFEKEDSRIKVIQSANNRGMVRNTNELILKAQGEYIAIINSDDFWEQNKLKKQVEFLDQNSEYGACFTDVNLINEQSKVLPQQGPFRNFKKNNYQWLNYFFSFGNCLCYPSSLVRKDCYIKVGLFNQAFICLLDFDMWVRLSIAGVGIYVVEEKLTNFRVFGDESNLSGKNYESLVRDVLEAEKVLFNYLNIKNYNEFIKIFDDYKSDYPNHKSYFYMVDYISDRVWKDDRIRNKRNILNFILHFMIDEIISNQENLEILERDFGFNFKKYLKITGLYPNGINSYNAKLGKKNTLIKKILSFFK